MKFLFYAKVFHLHAFKACGHTICETVYSVFRYSNRDKKVVMTLDTFIQIEICHSEGRSRHFQFNIELFKHFFFFRIFFRKRLKR